MTRLEFIAICGEYLILPELILEIESAREAIRNNDIKALRKIIESEC